MSKQYAERDASALDEAGGYYIRHVSAMTKEGLHSKSDIAAELGFRDMRIDHLAHRINQLLIERNATGLAIDHALRGVLPKQHGLLSRLQMLFLLATQRDYLLGALEKLTQSGLALITVDEVHDREDAATIESNFNDELIFSQEAIAKVKGGAA